MDTIYISIIFIVITLIKKYNVQGSPFGPNVAPIPPNQLYKQKINQPGCRDVNNFAKCMDGNEQLIDYGCRYYYSSYCYCCGVSCTYVEYGDICTKFCVKGSNSGVGEDPIIINLPFNWGDDHKCTQSSKNSSNGSKKTSSSLQLPKRNITTSLGTRNDMEETTVKIPQKIVPDCLGGNCPGVPTVSTPRTPAPIKPDCLGGNCPQKGRRAKKKSNTQAAQFLFPGQLKKSNTQAAQFLFPGQIQKG